MTDKEKAIVMAYTGICMLVGDKFQIFHKYVEDIMGRPVYTHEMATDAVDDEIKEKAKADFIALCKDVDPGEISDGYHTFNQLYHQRAILFATIVNQNSDIAWKSYKHSDGRYCFDSNGEWFIVGIDTPEGSYTYHYSKEYWDYFECKELDCGKEWDGHTEEDVTRLLSLKQKAGYWEWLPYSYPSVLGNWVCSKCKAVAVEAVSIENKHEIPTYNFCPQCGAKMEENIPKIPTTCDEWRIALKNFNRRNEK